MAYMIWYKVTRIWIRAPEKIIGIQLQKHALTLTGILARKPTNGFRLSRLLGITRHTKCTGLIMFRIAIMAGWRILMPPAMAVLISTMERADGYKMKFV